MGRTIYEVQHVRFVGPQLQRGGLADQLTPHPVTQRLALRVGEEGRGLQYTLATLDVAWTRSTTSPNRMRPMVIEAQKALAHIPATAGAMPRPSVNR